MCAGEHPSAQFHILEPVLFGHLFDIDFHTHVAQLAKIVIVTLIIARPAKEDVAANSDHRAGDIDNLVTIQKDAAFSGQSRTIPTKHEPHLSPEGRRFTRMINKWRPIDDARAAIPNVRDFRRLVPRRIQCGFGFQFLPSLPGLGRIRALYQEGGIEMRVPDFERSHFGELAHVLSVGFNRGSRCVGAVLPADFCLTHRKYDARGQSLYIPLPWSREGLIEIIAVENDLPIGRSEASEIRHMAIPAGLPADT